MLKLFLLIILNIIFTTVSFANGSDTTSTGGSETTPIPELTGQIYFYEEGGGPIEINNGEALFGTPIIDGEYGEKVNNNFINKNIEVSFYCTSTTCDSNTFDSILVNENGTGTLSIVDNLGRTLSIKYHVWKINKIKPVGSISYIEGNDIWVNGSKIAKLSGSATKFGDETWNTDWLVGNASPSFTCDIEGGCVGSLSITDSAGNTLIKSYNITNIDKTLPGISFFKYAEIVDGKQKVGVTCSDEGGSGCAVEGEVIYYLARGTHIKCVSDNAGNEKCGQVVATSDVNDFSDTNMGWKKGTRKLWLTCQDDMSGCVDNYKELIVDINGVYQITIKDNANITTTKQFLIEKIDNIKPEELNINTIFNPFKASDQNKIKISGDDFLSGVNTFKYKWDETCKDSTSIYGTEVINNEWINYTVSGNHILFLCLIDDVGNIKEVQKSITIYPGDLDQDKTTIELNGSKGTLFANNSDKYLYIIILRDKYNNVIYNKNIDTLEYTPLNISDTIQFDMTNPHSGEIATNLKYFGLTSNLLGEVRFSINSYVPGEFVERFKISMNKWGQSYTDNSAISEIFKYEKNSNTNIFKIPVAGDLSLIEGGSVPEIGKIQKYKIGLSKIDDNNLNITSNGNIGISKESIKTDNGHFWNTFGGINNYFGNNINNYLGFTGSIDVAVSSDVLSGVELNTDNLIISYNINTKDVKYYLDNFGTSGCNVATLGLKLIGNLQGDGKADITGQEKNFSDLTKGELRGQIRKNAYRLIRNRTSGLENINNIIYINGNKSYSDIKNILDENDTIIINEGNFIIDENIDTNIGIIVLKSNYLIKTDYNNVGNIYVDKDVEKINAIIYADGAFRSADLNGFSYNDNSLNKKLILNGSLFTRNTIGGSVKVETSYLLPGGEKITDFDLAEIYDLNYIRKVNNQCDLYNDYSFLIKYNPSVQLNPPKGFDIN